jgi:5'-3' exonuclease
LKGYVLILQEQKAPPIAEEFPNGEKVIFLGQMAYGAAAQVTSTSGDKLGISLAVCLLAASDYP